jgi:hypothetical protein
VSSFTEPLRVEVMGKEVDGLGMFAVLKGFRYEIGYLGSGDVVSVPAGFETDLVSLPRFARWFLPIAGRPAKAALLHDWLLIQKDPRAHEVFDEALKVAEVPTINRWIMVAGVKLWALVKRYCYR